MQLDDLVNAALRRLANALSVDVARHMREMRGVPGDVLAIRLEPNLTPQYVTYQPIEERHPVRIPTQGYGSKLTVVLASGGITICKLYEPHAPQSLEWLGVPGRWMFESVEATPERNVEVKLCEVSL